MLIVGNWKAYVETPQKAKKLLTTAKKLALSKKHEFVIAPPAPYIGTLATGKKARLGLGAQDVSATLGGAVTGEVTATALASLGVSYVIVGHSERRAGGETNEEILEKVRRTFAHGLTPILCVGERTRDEEATYLSFLRTQIISTYGALSQKERLTLVIAYEPVWAIGKSAGEAITPTDLHEMILYIRKILGEFLPGRGASKVRVLYGGSVDATNAKLLADATNIDGFLLGRASTDPSALSSLVRSVS